MRRPLAHAEESMAPATSLPVPSGDPAASPSRRRSGDQTATARTSSRARAPRLRSPSSSTRCRSVRRIAWRRWSPRRWPILFTISRTRRQSDPARHSPRGRAEAARLCRRPRRRSTSALADTATPDRTEPPRIARRAELGADRLGQRAPGHRAGLQLAAVQAWRGCRSACEEHRAYHRGDQYQALHQMPPSR